MEMNDKGWKKTQNVVTYMATRVYKEMVNACSLTFGHIIKSKYFTPPK